MRWLKRALAPLTALLLMAAGAAMPWAVFYVQDRYEEERQEERILDLFSLTLRQEADLSQTLGMIRDGNYFMQDWAQNAVLTEEEALAAVRNTLTAMVDFGLVEPWLPENISVFRAQLGAMVSEAGDLSLAVWTVYSTSALDRYNYFFLLDDASGKIFLANVPNRSMAQGDELYAAMESWRQFIEQYYGVEIHAVAAEQYDASVDFLMPFRLGEERESFQLGLYFTDNYVSLTPFT